MMGFSSRFLLLTLLGIVGLSLVCGECGSELEKSLERLADLVNKGLQNKEERLTRLENQFGQLTEVLKSNSEAVRIHQEATQSQFDTKFARFIDLIKENMAKAASSQQASQMKLEQKLNQLADAVKRNEASIKQMRYPGTGPVGTSMQHSASLCQQQNDSLVCQTSSSGPGWIVIQHRYDGPVNFNRDWSSYRDGFGTFGETGEFWWGLEKVHQLTKTGTYELLIELSDTRGEARFARYSEFVVEGEPDRYRLSKLGGYSGTAGDVNTINPRWIPTGQRFSTYDSDNDLKYGNCAIDKGSGWWYNDCGVGLNSNAHTFWLPWKNDFLPYTRMLIRPKQ